MRMLRALLPCLLCISVPPGATGQEPAKKVLLIGLDGVRVDIMARVEVPVIDSLAAAGFYSDEAKTRVRTMSGPGWSSMTIGARTDKHLVDSNNFEGNDYAAYPDFFDPHRARATGTEHVRGVGLASPGDDGLRRTPVQR